MELVRVDTQRAYEALFEKITTLELQPGAPLDVGALAEELGMGLVPVREALHLLAHGDLVSLSEGGMFASEVNPTDLVQLSELRLLLEGFAARLAAERADPDDLTVLEALRREAADVEAGDGQRLFDLDHKFHQAVARAAHNRYLASTLERFFGFSRRIWYLVLPKLEFLPAAVEEHEAILEAIRRQDPAAAERSMQAHVSRFYSQVQELLSDEGA